ncbi:MAG: protease modulator HflC [Planctomycetes bacterium]|nr:protease modulator HflC [Planctomycetota bacterium]
MNTKNDTNLSTSENEAWSVLKRRLVRGLLIMTALSVVAGLLGSAAVFVDETEYVFVERFGKIIAVYDRDQDRGLHFKCPWPIDTVRRFDRRVQLFDPPGREIHTQDTRNITIDIYVCWKIAEPSLNGSRDLQQRPVVQFFRGLETIGNAEQVLLSRVSSIVNTRIGQVELSSLLSVVDSESGPNVGEIGLLEQISNEVQKLIMKRPGETESIRDRLGVEIVDFRIKRINLPLGNQQSVFDRMRSERREKAQFYRSSGLAEKVKIESQAKRQSEEILAKANRTAEEIRGAAEAESIRLLNEAHQKDPEFYRLMRTLDTYKIILNEKTTLVLSASSNLFMLLTEGIPEEGPVPALGKPIPRIQKNKHETEKTTAPGNVKPLTNFSGDQTGDQTGDKSKSKTKEPAGNVSGEDSP